MKRGYMFVFLFILPMFLQGEGVGILFDNSGSMRMNFTNQMLQDAQETVLDLIFTGRFDPNTWRVEAQSDEFENRGVKPFWSPNDIIYLHAFGELTSRTEPFFRASPDYSEEKTEADARRYVQQQLFRRLNYQDQFTNFDLAKFLCWWNVGTRLGSQGRGYFMNVFIVSDFILDPNIPFVGAGDRIHNSFIENGAGETTLLKLVHSGPNPRSTNATLQIRLVRIGPHFIKPPPVGVSRPGEKDSIRLVKPVQNFKVGSKGSSQILFSWNAKGAFEKFILEIHSTKPKRAVHVRQVEGTQVNIPANLILQRMKRIKTKRLEWFVKGVYPEGQTSGNISITSDRRIIQLAKKKSQIWVLFLILLLIGLVILGLSQRERIVRWFKKFFHAKDEADGFDDDFDDKGGKMNVTADGDDW